MIFFYKTKTKINSLIFNLAIEIEDLGIYYPKWEILTQSGILGMSLAERLLEEENLGDFNFIEQLKNKNLISSYDFYFDFNNQNSGNIIIGSKPDEISKEKYNNKNYISLRTSSFNSDYDWNIKFDKIYYGDIKIKQIQQMALRIEFGLITGDSEWLNILEEQFFSKLVKNKTCSKEYYNEMAAYYIFFCYYCTKNINLSEFKPIIFTINEYNYNFSLTKDDLFLDIGDKYIFLMAFGKFSKLYLGYPFLKKYQLIFNQNDKTIGFYLDKKGVSPSTISTLNIYLIAIIILSSLLVCLIVFVIIYFCKKKKHKKEVVELLDENHIEDNNTNENAIIDSST